MPLDVAALQTRIEALAVEASKGSGQSHDWYVELFSRAVDLEFGPGDTETLEQAIAIARKFDYATPDELEQKRERQEEAGVCKHGLDSMTCPAGCFE